MFRQPVPMDAAMREPGSREPGNGLFRTPIAASRPHSPSRPLANLSQSMPGMMAQMAQQMSQLTHMTQLPSYPQIFYPQNVPQMLASTNFIATPQPSQPAVAIRKPVPSNSARKDKPQPSKDTSQPGNKEKDMPKWIPGNYNNKYLLGSAPKAKKDSHVSPQRLRRPSNSGNIHASQQQYEYGTPHAPQQQHSQPSYYDAYPADSQYPYTQPHRAASAPPVPYYPHANPAAHQYPPYPYPNHAYAAPNNTHTPHAHPPHTPHGGVVDNLTIGQLKEALQSLPTHIRTSLLVPPPQGTNSGDVPKRRRARDLESPPTSTSSSTAHSPDDSYVDDHRRRRQEHVETAELPEPALISEPRKRKGSGVESGAKGAVKASGQRVAPTTPSNNKPQPRAKSTPPPTTRNHSNNNTTGMSGRGTGASPSPLRASKASSVEKPSGAGKGAAGAGARAAGGLEKAKAGGVGKVESFFDFKKSRGMGNTNNTNNTTNTSANANANGNGNSNSNIHAKAPVDIEDPVLTPLKPPTPLYTNTHHTTTHTTLHTPRTPSHTHQTHTRAVDDFEWHRLAVWLEGLGLTQNYAIALQDAGVTSLSLLELQDERVLRRKMGMSPEDVRKVMEGLRGMGERIRTFSEGFNHGIEPEIDQEKNKSKPSVSVEKKANKAIDLGKPKEKSKAVSNHAHTTLSPSELSELLGYFDSGDSEQFFSLWSSLTDETSLCDMCMDAEERDVLTFHLHIHFVSLPSSVGEGLESTRERLHAFLEKHAQASSYTTYALPTRSLPMSSASKDGVDSASNGNMLNWRTQLRSRLESYALKLKLKAKVPGPYTLLPPPEEDVKVLNHTSHSALIAQHTKGEGLMDMAPAQDDAILLRMPHPQPVLLPHPQTQTEAPIAGSNMPMSPASVASSISQLTDDTFPASPHHAQPYPTHHTHGAQTGRNYNTHTHTLHTTNKPTTSININSSSHHIATTSGAIPLTPGTSGKGPVHSNPTTPLQAQVNAYNRLLKMKRMGAAGSGAQEKSGEEAANPSTTTPAAAPAPTATASPSPLKPLAFVKGLRPNATAPNTSASAGVSSLALARGGLEDQVSKYRAMLQNQKQRSVPLPASFAQPQPVPAASIPSLPLAQQRQQQEQQDEEEEATAVVLGGQEQQQDEREEEEEKPAANASSATASPTAVEDQAAAEDKAAEPAAVTDSAMDETQALEQETSAPAPANIEQQPHFADENEPHRPAEIIADVTEELGGMNAGIVEDVQDVAANDNDVAHITDRELVVANEGEKHEEGEETLSNIPQAEGIIAQEDQPATMLARDAGDDHPAIVANGTLADAEVREAVGEEVAQENGKVVEEGEEVSKLSKKQMKKLKKRMMEREKNATASL